MTPQIESYIVAGTVRPFCYRLVGTRKWFLGVYLVGCADRTSLRQQMEPKLGPVEIDMRPEKRPSGIGVEAWAAELAHRRRETHRVAGHG
jgi:hypothetical protein